MVFLHFTKIVAKIYAQNVFISFAFKWYQDKRQKISLKMYYPVYIDYLQSNLLVINVSSIVSQVIFENILFVKIQDMKFDSLLIFCMIQLS